MIPRHVAIYLAHILTQRTYNEIAMSFAHRDHTTILYAVERTKWRMQRDTAVAKAVREIRERLLRETLSTISG